MFHSCNVNLIYYFSPRFKLPDFEDKKVPAVLVQFMFSTILILKMEVKEFVSRMDKVDFEHISCIRSKIYIFIGIIINLNKESAYASAVGKLNMDKYKYSLVKLLIFYECCRLC